MIFGYSWTTFRRLLRMVLSPKSTSRGWTTFAFICLRSTLLIVVTFFYFQHIDRIGHWINPVVETPTWGETIKEVSSLARRSNSTNLERLLLGSGKWVYYYHSLVPTLIRNLCAFLLLPFSTISFLFIFLANHLALVSLAPIFHFSYSSPSSILILSFIRPCVFLDFLFPFTWFV